MENIGHHRAKAFFIRRDFACEAHAHKSAAMKTTAKSDDSVSAGGDAGDFYRIFDSFCTRGDKNGFFVELAWDECVQAFGQFDIIGIRHNLVAGVGKGVNLGFKCCNYFGVAMACIDYGNARCEVDVPCAFDIPNFGIFGFGSKNIGLHADALGDRV